MTVVRVGTESAAVMWLKLHGTGLWQDVQGSLNIFNTVQFVSRVVSAMAVQFEIHFEHPVVNI